MTSRLYSVAPWGNLSGAPICALEHAKALRDRFDEVQLVLCQHGPLEERAREAGIPVWCRPFAFRGLRRAGIRKFLGHIGEVVRSRLMYVRDLRRLLKDRPGILHIHSRAAHLPYALLAGRLAHVPVVVTIHEPWEEGGEARSELWLVRWLADRVVFLTHAMVAQYPPVIRHPAVVYNHAPLPPVRRAPENPRPLLVMAAQMVKAKGIDVYLEVCRRLQEREVPFDAWMVGGWLEEDVRAEAEQFIRQHQLETEVTIQGVQPQMEPVYARMDVLLLPTLRDSFPRVVMEAMCHGIPVVATRVDGIPEMVEDGVTGLLVAPGDAAGFTAAAEKLLRDPELRARLGAAGRRRAEELFAPAKYAEAMERVYAGLPAADRPEAAS